MVVLLAVIEYRSPETNRKSKMYLFECDTCEKVFRAPASRNRGRQTQFCDTTCYGKYRAAHPEMWAKSIEAMNAPGEHRTRAIKKRQAKWDSGELQHPWVGKKHSNESIQKMKESHKGIASGEKNGMFGKTHSEDTRQKMSDAKTQLILDGKLIVYGTRNKKGWYESTKTKNRYFYRSGWERALMNYLDNEPSVKSWEYEKIRIPYFYEMEQKQRWYVPDFLITRVSGERLLLEVKPKQFVDSSKTVAKTFAGHQWCQNNNATFVIATKELLLEWGVDFQPTYDAAKDAE